MDILLAGFSFCLGGQQQLVYLPREASCCCFMKITDAQIERLIDIHQKKFGVNLNDKKEAQNYLETIAKIMSWLLRHEVKTPLQGDQTDD